MNTNKYNPNPIGNWYSLLQFGSELLLMVGTVCTEPITIQEQIFDMYLRLGKERPLFSRL